ncbi:MAG: FecCD family ABC transporter permease [Candidatus Cryptobacteroides sp.]
MSRKHLIFFVLSAVLCLAAMLLSLLTGASRIPPADVCRALAGLDCPPEIRAVVLEIRLPRSLAALLAGSAMSVCGLMMQTMFSNPLAGPYVLGVNSGASLGAALLVLGLPRGISSGVSPSFFSGSLALAGASWAGAAVVLLLVALAGRRLRNIMALLVLGLMTGSAVDSLVQILQYFSDSDSLKTYVLWTMGSLGGVPASRIPLMSVAVLMGLLIAFVCSKPLNQMLAGEQYARTMGMDVRLTRLALYLATILLAGTVTAFCGPIGFVGLAVPHITRALMRTADHRLLVPGTLLCGAFLMSACDLLARTFTLPVNALTSFLGIPVVLWIIFRRKSGYD